MAATKQHEKYQAPNCGQGAHEALKASGVEAFYRATDSTVSVSTGQPLRAVIYDGADDVTTVMRICRACGTTVAVEVEGRWQPAAKEGT